MFVSVRVSVMCVIDEGSPLRHSSPNRILRASVSTSEVFVFFFSGAFTCAGLLACDVFAFELDLVVLLFTGGVRPAAPGNSAPLEDIPFCLLSFTTVDILLSIVGFFVEEEDVTVNYDYCFTLVWRSYVVVTEKGSPSQVLDPQIQVTIHVNKHRSGSAFDQAVNPQIQIWVTRRSTHAQP
jgi:hypothetical protein